MSTTCSRRIAHPWCVRNGRNGYIPMMLLYPPWNLPMSEAPIPVTHLPSRKVVFLRCEPCRDLATASLEPKIRVWNLLGFWDTVPTRECVYTIYIRGFHPVGGTPHCIIQSLHLVFGPEPSDCRAPYRFGIWINNDKEISKLSNYIFDSRVWQ